jgi:hypothetical protein
MASDRLFELLSQAKSQPSHAYRTAEAALAIPGQALEGYQSGLEARSKIDQYRLLNSKLGDLYQGGQIPFGLSPDHSVKDLLTLAPAMENYIPGDVLQSISGAYSGNATPTQPQQRAVPQASPDSPVLPNPGPNAGTQHLQDIEGTGAGDQNAISPGQPLGLPAPNQVAGNSGVTFRPPQGGMNSKSFKEIVAPALNAQRERQQFMTGQQNEDRRQQERILDENLRQQRGLDQSRDLTNKGHMASVADKIAPSLPEIGVVKNLVSQIEPLLQQNRPIPGLGNVGASLANASGGFGTDQMKRSLAINNAAGAISAALDKIIAGRFNENEAELLKKTMVPTGNDQPAYAQDKLNKLKGFISTYEKGNEQAVSNMAAAITGGQISAVAPSSSGPQTNSYASESEVPPNLPRGTIITVNGRRAVIR